MILLRKLEKHSKIYHIFKKNKCVNKPLIRILKKLNK